MEQLRKSRSVVSNESLRDLQRENEGLKVRVSNVYTQKEHYNSVLLLDVFFIIMRHYVDLFWHLQNVWKKTPWFAIFDWILASVVNCYFDNLSNLISSNKPLNHLWVVLFTRFRVFSTIHAPINWSLSWITQYCTTVTCFGQCLTVIQHCLWLDNA